MVMTVAGIAGRDRGERAPRGFSGLRRVGAVRRLLRCTSGISSVEFAIILPLLMMFLFSIIAFGTALYANANMENAAREAVRRMAVAEVTGLGTPVTCTSAQALDTTTAEFRACAYLINWPNSILVTADSPGGCPGSQSHRDGRRRRCGHGRCLRLLQRKNLDRRGHHAPGGGLRLRSSE